MPNYKLSFTKTPKQIEAINLMSTHIEVLLEGGSRSGKTFIACYAALVRAAKHARTNHLLVRRHFNHIKQSIGYETMPDVLATCFPKLKCELNKTDWFFELTNKSTVWLGGTDDKDRTEKLLGREWETIFLNEASQFGYATYELLKTRLNPKQGVKPLFLVDYNPPSKRHWGYQIFHKGINPETGEPLADPDRYAMIHMNPTDNLANLSDTYIQTLESMGEKRRNRFLYGLYSDDTEGALWKREWIQDHRKQSHPDLERVVVGVDPAVTGNENSDDTGIVIAGRAMIDGEYHYYVLSDRTIHGGVTGWGKAVAYAYSKYMADCVVGEVNQGGDLVEMNIKNFDRNINYKSVRATRGKARRAEPIAELYERGLVHHVGEPFIDLEDQLCAWTPESSESPDNMDALVWALAHLSETGGGWYSGVA